MHVRTPGSTWARRDARIPRTSWRAMRLATGATVAVTAAIVVSGAAVRLSDSGLGCPTWPNCRAGQLSSAGLDLHGAIEFGNRVVTVAIPLIVALMAVMAHRLPQKRPDLRLRGNVMVAGIVANAVVGGLTVLFDLQPLLVAFHFLLNMALLWVAIDLHRRTGSSVGGAATEVHVLSWLQAVASGLVLIAGTLTTGTGPHAGDDTAPRLGFALERITAVHAELAMITTGLVLALVVLATVQVSSALAQRRIRALAVVIVAQAGVGFAQYLTDLPAALILVHVAGATALWGLSLGVVQATRPWHHMPTGTQSSGLTAAATNTTVR